MTVREELPKARRMLTDTMGRARGQGELEQEHPCDDLLADYAADDVDSATGREIARHLAACPACAEEEKRLRLLAGRWSGDYGARRLTDLGASILKETDEALRKWVVNPTPEQVPLAANTSARKAALVTSNKVNNRVDVAPARKRLRMTAAAVIIASGLAAGWYFSEPLQGSLISGLHQLVIFDALVPRQGPSDVNRSIVASLSEHAERFQLPNSGSLLFSDPAKVWVDPDAWWAAWNTGERRDEFSPIENSHDGVRVRETQRFMVFFDHNRVNLSPEAIATIRTAVTAYMANPGAKVILIGHTDTAGSYEYNLGLSQRRANAAREALSRQGVPASAFEIIAKGEQGGPVVTAQGVREAQNRSTEIVLQWTDPPAREPGPITKNPIQSPAKPNQSASKGPQPARKPSLSNSKQNTPSAKGIPTGRYMHPASSPAQPGTAFAEGWAHAGGQVTHARGW